MSGRYFVQSPIQTDSLTLAGSEARHLATVMRAKVGTVIVLFDGSGAEFTAQVIRTSHSEVQLQILSRQIVDREVSFPLTLGVALPKGDRQRWLIEKAVELGVTAVVPLVTTRAVAQPTEAALKRLRRVVVEASKQCGRNRLMDVFASRSLSEHITQVPPEVWRLIAHPSGWRLPARSRPQGAVSLAIGPEGGFTEYELTQAIEAGWVPVSLGPRMLRVETAAIALIASLTVGT